MNTFFYNNLLIPENVEFISPKCKNKTVAWSKLIDFFLDFILSYQYLIIHFYEKSK
jgi:hypothetical protein